MHRASLPALRIRFALASILLACLSALGCSRGAGEIPELSKRSEYKKIFASIDQAEAIADPLERCLAYPDPPHLAWPKPLVRALCEDVFAPGLQTDDLKQSIDRRDWVGLHDRYTEYLERHYSGADPEKVLYRAFPIRSWKSDEEADRYTSRWVAARPEDPFANTARGAYLTRAAWNVRGERTIRHVPQAAQQRMYELAVEAAGHLRKAIENEPKLMPAYYYLMDAYALGGKSGWIPIALDAATQQSPDTYYVRGKAANFLQIKWGGSSEEMDALIADAEDRLDENPRLAMVRIDRDRERADAAFEIGHYKPALAQYRRALAFGPDINALENAADVAPRLGYNVERLIYLTQAYRFQKQPLDLLLARGLMWESDGDFTRAKRDYRTAKMLYPQETKVDKRIADAKKREALVREKLRERQAGNR